MKSYFNNCVKYFTNMYLKNFMPNGAVPKSLHTNNSNPFIEY